MTTAQALARLEVRLARMEALLESLAVDKDDMHVLGDASTRTTLRLAEVKKKTGLSRATIYAQQTQGIFPKSINLGVRAVGWIEREIDAVMAARANGADENALKKLVELLIARRHR